MMMEVMVDFIFAFLKRLLSTQFGSLFSSAYLMTEKIVQSLTQERFPFYARILSTC
jgi:hypothetical protein